MLRFSQDYTLKTARAVSDTCSRIIGNIASAVLFPGTAAEMNGDDALTEKMTAADANIVRYVL